MTLTFRVDYPVIGNVTPVATGIIKEIHVEYDRPNGEGSDNHEVLARDIIRDELYEN